MVSCLEPEDLHQSQQHPDDNISVAPGEGQQPCSVFQEMKVFPYLFPEGINGFDQKRNTKLGLGRYFNARLFSKDNRFASDPQTIMTRSKVYLKGVCYLQHFLVSKLMIL